MSSNSAFGEVNVAGKRRTRSEPVVICSFCGKSQADVRKIIAGPMVYICDDCIGMCVELLGKEERKAKRAERQRSPIPKPSEIKAALDLHVIGQEHAKKVLSVAVYNHYKRIESDSDEDAVELHKSNILLLGPSGCGKTLLAQTLARILDVPFCIADATVLTQAGYVGEDVENVLTRLLWAADGNIEQAQRGIVYIDEMDKTARKIEDPSSPRDVGGEGVQQSLLKILEGTIANVPLNGGRKTAEQKLVQIDTTDILFICGGAFSELVPIIERRLGQQRVGFGVTLVDRTHRSSGETLAKVCNEDLLKFGLIPELVGRLPVVATLDELDEEGLVRVLTEPKNALVRQYEKLFELDGVQLRFSKSALWAVARKALEQKTGARGLRSVLENALLELMYDLPSQEDIVEVSVCDRVITRNKRPVLRRAKQKTAS